MKKFEKQVDNFVFWLRLATQGVKKGVDLVVQLARKSYVKIEVIKKFERKSGCIILFVATFAWTIKKGVELQQHFIKKVIRLRLKLLRNQEKYQVDNFAFGFIYLDCQERC